VRNRWARIEKARRLRDAGGTTRNKCHLCGQPKRGHVCPARPSNSAPIDPTILDQHMHSLVQMPGMDKSSVSIARELMLQSYVSPSVISPATDFASAQLKGLLQAHLEAIFSVPPTDGSAQSAEAAVAPSPPLQVTATADPAPSAGGDGAAAAETTDGDRPLPADYPVLMPPPARRLRRAGSGSSGSLMGSGSSLLSSVGGAGQPSQQPPGRSPGSPQLHWGLDTLLSAAQPEAPAAGSSFAADAAAALTGGAVEPSSLRAPTPSLRWSGSDLLELLDDDEEMASHFEELSSSSAHEDERSLASAAIDNQQPQLFRKLARTVWLVQRWRSKSELKRLCDTIG